MPSIPLVSRLTRRQQPTSELHSPSRGFARRRSPASEPHTPSRGFARRRSPASEPHTPNPSLVLAIILGSYLMVVLDVSVIITALPQIHRDLHFSSDGLSWVQSAYALTFGGLLLLGARAGDILGRRRVFMAGIGLFSITSLIGGLAQSADWLLAARAVQGVAAAVAAPSTLALLTTSFPEGRERTKAIAAYAAVAGGGGSVGLVLGGMLTDLISWRWGLFINVPVGLVLISLAPRYLAETPRRPGHFDLPGALASTLGMTALVYGFVRAASDGWGNAITVASFASAAVLLFAFVVTERRATQPITPLRLFASRQRAGAYLARLLVVGAMFSMFFFLTQYLQGARGFNPLEAGVAFLPMTLVMFAMVRIVPQLTERVGPTRLLLGGLVVALAGMAWLSRLTLGSAYLPEIAVPLVLLGAGMGMAFTPLTTAGIAGVAPEDAGSASGVVNAAQQLGGSLGLSALVTVFASATRSATEHPLAGVSARTQAHYVLSHAVATAVTGSALLLALALLVSIVAVRPARQRAEASALVEAA
jgi:EmrB/QacA subfamily drug resistance transporter